MTLLDKVKQFVNLTPGGLQRDRVSIFFHNYGKKYLVERHFYRKITPYPIAAKHP